MGLILEPDRRFVVLSDIMGMEDSLGDMDLKVAGDGNSITAFQMDIKVCDGDGWGINISSSKWYYRYYLVLRYSDSDSDY